MNVSIRAMELYHLLYYIKCGYNNNWFLKTAVLLFPFISKMWKGLLSLYLLIAMLNIETRYQGNVLPKGILNSLTLCQYFMK